jgi:predicted RNA-binding protein with PUA-like domain
MKYWLMKSEPHVYSYDDLVKDGRTLWDGVRNYQARNFMRDAMTVGDQVLFYHSNTKPPGVAGVCEVASDPYPDPTQFDPASNYHDPKSDPDNPRWMLVDVTPVQALPRLVSLEELRGTKSLAKMALLQRGQRLSIQPVSASEFRTVLRVAAKGPATPAGS